jgi:hypothetical protein
MEYLHARTGEARAETLAKEALATLPHKRRQNQSEIAAVKRLASKFRKRHPKKTR